MYSIVLFILMNPFSFCQQPPIISEHVYFANRVTLRYQYHISNNWDIGICRRIFRKEKKKKEEEKPNMKSTKIYLSSSFFEICY